MLKSLLEFIQLLLQLIKQLHIDFILLAFRLHQLAQLLILLQLLLIDFPLHLEKLILLIDMLLISLDGDELFDLLQALIVLLPQGIDLAREL